MSVLDNNKAIVDQCIQALFSRGEFDSVERYLAPDFVNHNPNPGYSPDQNGFRRVAADFRAAFPDWHSELHELIAERDLVVERFTAGGTHCGLVMGVAPTNRAVTLPGINIFRIADGQIVERWGQLDVLGLLQQLGAVPSG
jgi:steroid delta-isomerase-like uncharacterized protein